MWPMIRSLANTKVKQVRRLQSDRRFRAREKAFVVEGTRWLAELVQWANPPQIIFYTEDWLDTPAHGDILQQLDAPAQSVSAEVMAAMSATTTAPGVLAVVPAYSRPLPENPSLLLILDRLKTPGNLGTMLRTAAAAGVDGVLLAPGSVDAYNPKVVRGSMGALLRLPVEQAGWPEIAERVAGLQVWLAAADGDVSYTAVNWQEPSALIIGSEAWGAGDEAQRVASGRVAIPMQAATESLNAAVAAGVILFEAVRQRN
jgi:TrmH family RNA methyltransferase